MNLNRISKDKLFAAGYIILRGSDIWQPKEGKSVPCIKQSNYDGVWRLYGKYATKKERDRVMRGLVADKESKYIMIEEER